MKPHVWLILIVLSLIVTVGQQPASQDQRTESSTKQLYVRTGNEATVGGAVNIMGEAPSPKKIDMTADPVCVQLNEKPTTQSVLVNGDRLRNVLVYVKRGTPLDKYRFEVPKGDVVFDHQNCQYSPRVLPVRVGQRLIINNLDATYHNTHPTPKDNQEWNQTQPAGAEPLVKSFSRAEVPIPFKCNQHPWEKAYLAVLDHPFVSVSDELGNFQISGLPPGTYTFVAWHELFGEQEREVTLAPNDNINLYFTFSAPENKQ